jgi:hypothetical protein
MREIFLLKVTTVDDELEMGFRSATSGQIGQKFFQASELTGKITISLAKRK